MPAYFAYLVLSMADVGVGRHPIIGLAEVGSLYGLLGGGPSPGLYGWGDPTPQNVRVTTQGISQQRPPAEWGHTTPQPASTRRCRQPPLDGTPLVPITASAGFPAPPGWCARAFGDCCLPVGPSGRANHLLGRTPRSP